MFPCDNDYADGNSGLILIRNSIVYVFVYVYFFIRDREMRVD